MTLRIHSGAGRVMLAVVEPDGSTNDVDLTPFAQTLLDLGCAKPRSQKALSAATSTLGVLSCDREIRFFDNGRRIPDAAGLAVLSDGLYRVLLDCVEAFSAPVGQPV